MVFTVIDWGHEGHMPTLENVGFLPFFVNGATWGHVKPITHSPARVMSIMAFWWPHVAPFSKNGGFLPFFGATTWPFGATCWPPKAVEWSRRR